MQPYGAGVTSLSKLLDECQLECHPDDAAEAGGLFVEGLRYAAELFKLTIPLDGEVKIGPSWAATH